MNQNTFHSLKRVGTIVLLIGVFLFSQAIPPKPVRAEPSGASSSNTVLPAIIGGCSIFPANNIWNTPVDSLPVHARSSQWINSIGRDRGFHMDFGTKWEGDPIGIPYNVVGSGVPKVSVTFEYDDESDDELYPIPADPLIEAGSDRHILIVDSSTCTLYELFAASKSGSHWYAGSGAIWDLNSNALRPDTWTSADAAGLPILPGLVRYDEVASGEIDHAIRFTASRTAGYIWPARHQTSNPQNGIPPMGARFRLKDSYDTSDFSPELQPILQAMKRYGIILADNGSNWYISGAPDPRWDDGLLHDLDVLTGDDFEAVDTSGLMVDPDSGATPVQVTTTNDSGAGSLRQAIADALPGDRILFDSALAGQTITLASNLVIDKDLILDASGLFPQLTISGGNIAHLEISSGSTVKISDVTITDGNYGISVRGNLTITNSTLKDNVDYSGGAISIYNGSLTIENSTITQNHSNYGGGAIFVGGAGHARIVNSTVTQNQADHNGGAIFLNESATAEIINSTFAENSAPDGSEISIMGTVSHLTLSNTIFACAQTAEVCYDYSPGTVASTGSILGVGTLADFGISPLADNGGPTQTMALLPDSPLIDAGDDATCTAADQRGVIRRQGSHCDIGAFEFNVFSPFLSAPANSEVLLHRRPTFDWTNVPGAASYRIAASRSSTFSTLLWKIDTTGSTYTPPADLPAGKVIYWRVRARVGTTWKPWSETWSFRTAKPPSIPVLVAPANKAITRDYTPLLNWNNSTIPSGGAAFDHYQVQVSTDKTFPDPLLVDANDVITSSYAPAADLDPNRRYYWRVRAFNVDGQYSSWSTVWSFFTALLPPSNLTPTDGEVVPTRKPLLNWDAVEGATGYDLQISTSDSFATLLVNTTVTADTFTSGTRLPANKTLYWRVRATGSNGPSRWVTTSFHTP